MSPTISDQPGHVDLFAQRRQKLEQLRTNNLNPFANEFSVTHDCGAARQLVEDGKLAEDSVVKVAGRVSAIRNMGNSAFFDLRDFTGRIQVFLQRKGLTPTEAEVFDQLDLGDILGVEGTIFRTKAGEISVKLTSPMLLAKALQPPPSNFHGLEDVETRYRQRYLDLIANPGTCSVFVNRSRIVKAIRDFLHESGFMEVETPMLQAVPGGAAAQPFITHHNALGIPLYMRIAPELYLKRMLVGGMTRIFEIGRNFRNEGISRRHNPEFTMLEVYQAYSNCSAMMNLTESLIVHLARVVTGGTTIEFRNAEGLLVRTIDLSPGWRRVPYRTLIRDTMGDDWFDLTVADKRRRAEAHGLPLADSASKMEMTQSVFEKLIEPTLINPTFVTHLPKSLVPLAKSTPEDPSTVDVFECCINGQEIAPGYSEQNDPIAQRRQLEDQAGDEPQRIDEEFLIALEHGMPPAGGIGIGIDRLCMLLLAQENIRDVILFPQMRPRV